MLNDDVLLTIIKENFDRLDNSLNKSIGYKGIIDTNLNDCIETGFYSVKVGTENIPINEDSFLMVYNESTSLVQLWYSSTSDRQRIRRKNNDTWGDWYVVYTEKEPQDLSAYATISSPIFTNSISLGRKTSSTVGSRSMAIGYNTEATSSYTQAFGYYTVASNTASHAEGYYSEAKGKYAHAEGNRTLASSESQHVQGKYNVEDTAGTYAHIVGNGTSTSKRSNAHTLDWNGNAWFKGNVSVNGTPTNDNDLVTKKYVDDNEFSGSYNDLVDKPTIPTNTSEMTNDSNFITIDDVHTHNNKDIIDTITQATMNTISSAITYKGIVQSSGDLNNCTTTGFYKIQQGARNLPVNEYSFLMVYNEPGQSTLIQVWYSATSDKQRMRRRANNTWGSWYTVYTENEPPTIPTSLPANGGNADTVGGYTIWTGTQTEYDALGTYSNTTIYMIKEG